MRQTSIVLGWSLSLLGPWMPASARAQDATNDPAQDATSDPARDATSAPDSLDPVATSPPDGAAPADPLAPEELLKQQQETTRALREAAQNLQQASTELREASRALEKADDDQQGSLLRVEGLKNHRGWTGAIFEFSESEMKATASATLALDSISRILVSVTAPLDKKTRLAAFTEDGRALPFLGSISFEYDGIQALLQNILEDPKLATPKRALAEDFELSLGDGAELGGELQASLGVPQYVDFLKSKYCKGFERAYPAGVANSQEPPCEQLDGDNPQHDAKLAALEKFAAQRAADVLRPGVSSGPFSLPVPAGARVTYGATITAGYDQQKIYVDDIATSAKKKRALEVEGRAFARFYPENWLAVPVSLGVRYADKPKAERFERCVEAPSSDPTITGSSCDSDALLLQEEGKARLSGLVEVAVVVMPFPSRWKSFAPGVEVRGRLEGVGQEELSRVSAGLFVTPTQSPIVTRFGIAAEHLHNFDTKDSDFRPVLLVGGSI